MLGRKKEEEEKKEEIGFLYSFSHPPQAEVDPCRLPPSTAPAAIPSGRPKRQRAISDYKALYTIGIRRGGYRQ
jgi:hypothetical protein